MAAIFNEWEYQEKMRMSKQTLNDCFNDNLRITEEQTFFFNQLLLNNLYDKCLPTEKTVPLVTAVKQIVEKHKTKYVLGIDVAKEEQERTVFHTVCDGCLITMKVKRFSYQKFNLCSDCQERIDQFIIKNNFDVVEIRKIINKKEKEINKQTHQNILGEF